DGNDLPSCLYAQETNPEQSNCPELGSCAPKTYVEFPIYFFPAEMALPPPPLLFFALSAFTFTSFLSLFLLSELEELPGLFEFVLFDSVLFELFEFALFDSVLLEFELFELASFDSALFELELFELVAFKSELFESFELSELDSSEFESLEFAFESLESDSSELESSSSFGSGAGASNAALTSDSKSDKSLSSVSKLLFLSSNFCFLSFSSFLSS